MRPRARMLGVAAVALALSAAPAHAAFTQPADTISGPGASTPGIDLNPTGAAAAAWDRAGSFVAAATRPADGGFGPEQDLYTLADPSTSSLSGAGDDGRAVAIDAAGTVVVVWSRFAVGESRIEAAVRPAGQTDFAPVETVSGGGGATYSSPAIDVNPAGDFVVVWIRNGIVQQRTRSAGSTTFGSVQDLTTAGNATRPDVDVGRNGTTTVAWQRGGIIEASTRQPTASSFATLEPLTAGGDFADFPQVAVDPVGNSFVVWVATDGTFDFVRLARRPAGAATSFGGGEDISLATGSAVEPEVGVDSQGNATVVYAQESGASFVVRARRRAPGGTLSAVQDLSTGGGENLHPALAVADGGTGDGRAAVVWERSTDPSSAAENVVQGTERPGPDASFGLAQTLGAGQSQRPQVDIDDAGRATAVWEFTSGGQRVIQASNTAPPAQPPQNTAPPSVSRTGDTLTAAPGTWTGTPTITFAYQWQQCQADGANCGPIDGATSQTYPLTAADMTRAVRVQVTATNTAGNHSAVSQQPVGDLPPSVTGTAREGETLTADSGTWTSAQGTNSFTRQWLRCDAAGAGCAEIAGATAGTYVLTAADVDARIRVRVTAQNEGGIASRQSEPTGAVTPRHVNSAAPTISGTPREGETLTATAGSWTGSPTGFTYQWQRCETAGADCTSFPAPGANIAGATGQTYVPVAADVGRRLRVLVTPTGGSTPKESAPTAVIEAAGSAAASKPTPTSSPTITPGNPKAGDTLTASRGAWTGTEPISFTYEWKRCDASGSCSPLTGAGSSGDGACAGEKCRLWNEDTGFTVHLRVVASNAAGQTSADAAPTAPVQGVTPSAVQAPTIKGTPVVGGQLELDGIGVWDPPSNGGGFSWQWLRCDGSGEGCQPIGGAAGEGADAAPYTVAPVDGGTTIRLQVSRTNSAGTGSSRSAPSGVVPKPIQKPATAQRLLAAPAGKPQVGERLFSQRGVWTGTEPIAYSYRWQRCGNVLFGFGPVCQPITDAPGEPRSSGPGAASYVVREADIGRSLRVIVTATNAAGSTERASATTTAAIDDPSIRKMPDLRGLDLSAGQERAEKALGHGSDTNVTLASKRFFQARDDLPKRPGGGRWVPGQIVRQAKPEPGDRIRVGNRTPVEVRVEFWMGSRPGDPELCDQLRKTLKLDDLDAAIEELAAAKCPVDDLLIEKDRRAREVEVKRATEGRDGKIDITVRVPAKPASYDLRLFVGPGTRGGTNADPYIGSDWKLTAGQGNRFGVQVVDRSGRLAGNSSNVPRAKQGVVRLDGAGVGIAEERAIASDGGPTGFNVDPTKAGTIDILAIVRDRNGEEIYGFGQVQVADRSDDNAFETVIGTRYKRRTVGDLTRFVYDEAANRRARARAANIGAILAALQRLLGNAGSSAGSAADQTLRYWNDVKASALQGLMGSVAQVISAGGANVISAGGANVISAGGANVISAGGANVISAGGANVITAGGANAISAGGANVITAGGANVISAGGANAISAGGANRVSYRGQAAATFRAGELISGQGRLIDMGGGCGLLIAPDELARGSKGLVAACNPGIAVVAPRGTR